MHVDQLGGEVGVRPVGGDQQLGLDRPDHLHRRGRAARSGTPARRAARPAADRAACSRRTPAPPSGPRRRHTRPDRGCSSRRRSSARDATDRNRTTAARRPAPGGARSSRPSPCRWNARELDAGRRPVGGGDPAPAMLQLPGRVAPPAAAAHDEHPHRRLIERRAPHHMVEEAQPVGAPVAGPGIERAHRARTRHRRSRCRCGRHASTARGSAAAGRVPRASGR